jgi:hypothetical protein
VIVYYVLLYLFGERKLEDRRRGRRERVSKLNFRSGKRSIEITVLAQENSLWEV